MSNQIFKHRETDRIIALTSLGMKEYVRGEWQDIDELIQPSEFIELSVTDFPLLYAGLERHRTWTCCGGYRLFANQKCSVCGESY